jgi:cob(I)alamin adenosyltransferase
MKLYTKTGDTGETGLFGGTRVFKNDIRIEAYGTVDELNAFIGLLISFIHDEKVLNTLLSIQNQLFNIGAYLAADTSKSVEMQTSLHLTQPISDLEHEIDRLQSFLPPLQHFILPGGSHQGAYAHVCRTVTRRVERRLFDMHEHFPIEKEVLIYINRLSDYFFALSRYLTIMSGGKDFFWEK